MVLSMAFLWRINLAAAFWTLCINFMLDDGNPASIEFA